MDGVDGGLLRWMCFDCVRVLLTRGADMSMKNKDGKTAKDLAEVHGHVNIVRMLDEVCIFQAYDKCFKHCHP